MPLGRFSFFQNHGSNFGFSNPGQQIVPNQQVFPNQQGFQSQQSLQPGFQPGLQSQQSFQSGFQQGFQVQPGSGPIFSNQQGFPNQGFMNPSAMGPFGSGSGLQRLMSNMIGQNGSMPPGLQRRGLLSGIGGLGSGTSGMASGIGQGMAPNLGQSVTPGPGVNPTPGVGSGYGSVTPPAQEKRGIWDVLKGFFSK